MYRTFFDLDPGPIALTFGLQPASPERIDSIETPRTVKIPLQMEFSVGTGATITPSYDEAIKRAAANIVWRRKLLISACGAFGNTQASNLNTPGCIHRTQL